MRVLFTTFSYLPERSGIPSVVKYLAEGLSERGYEVCVATSRNNHDFPFEENINGVYVKRFDIQLSILKKPSGDIQRYVDFVINYKKDVLIMECFQCVTTDALLPFLHLIKCKKIIHAHGAPGIYEKPIKIMYDLKHTIGHSLNWWHWKHYYKNFFPRYSNYIDASISCSLCASDLPYFSKHIRKNYILENSADLMFFQSIKSDIDIRRTLGIKSERFIVNIATINDRKNQSLLIDTYKDARLYNCALVIIGTERSAYYDRLVRKAQRINEKYNTEILIFDKNVKRDLFPEILLESSLFVLTSRWEEYPISIVESMAVGTPFLSTFVGNAHILPGGITARTPKEFSSLLKVLFDNTNYLNIYGECAKKYAEDNNKPEVVINNLLSIINSLDKYN